MSNDNSEESGGPSPDAWLFEMEEDYPYDRTANMVRAEKDSGYNTGVQRQLPLYGPSTIQEESTNAWECIICGYISTDKSEVTNCCDADAVHIDIVKTEVFGQ